VGGREKSLLPNTCPTHESLLRTRARSSATLALPESREADIGSFRFRRSIKLGPGVRLNLSKTGVGMSYGVPGARRSFHSSGRQTASVGIPGTGLGYVHTNSGGRRTAAPAELAAKPGLFAPKHEKEFYKALQAYVQGETERARELFRSASEKDTGGRVLADDLLAGMLSLSAEKPDEAIPHLEEVVSSEVELPDELMTKYGFGGGIKLKVTERVMVEVEWGSLAAALALVECYQEQGRIEEAIGVLQQLADADENPAILLSLCDLYAQTGAWDELVDAAAGTSNEDDVTLEIRLLQARALREQALDEAALDAYKDALRSKKRNPELLKEARYERGKLLLARGKSAQAMRDLQTVFADDPHYKDVAALVRDGAGGRP
jgi:tetratricopeptide (TPR) repeat protein